MRYFWSLSIFYTNPTHFPCSWGSLQVPQVSGSCQCTNASETEGSSLGGPRKVESLDTLPSSSPSHSTPSIWELGFVLLCLLALCWTRNGYSGDLQPKSVSLFSLAPRWLNYARTHQHSKIDKSEVVRCEALRKVVVLEAWTNSFPQWGEAGSCGFCPLTLYWAKRESHGI